MPDDVESERPETKRVAFGVLSSTEGGPVAMVQRGQGKEKITC